MDERWLTAVGLALTGEQIEASASGPVHGSDAAAWLLEHGWPPERVQQHRHDMVDQEVLWPHALPADLLGRGTAAQFHALLEECRTLLGVSGAVSRMRPAETHLTPDDLRLIAELPPHHGHVG